MVEQINTGVLFPISMAVIKTENSRGWWGQGEMEAFCSMRLFAKAIVKHMEQQHLVSLHTQDEHHHICYVWL